MSPENCVSCSAGSLPPLHRRLLGLISRAVRDFDLLSPGDRIAVGVSGGKDSLSLLHLLREWPPGRRLGLSILAVHIDLGFPDGREDEARLREYLQAQGYAFRIVATDIAVRARGPAARKNPCFLCARWRRQRLFEVAVEEGCTKVALAHHQDDILETFFLNLFYSCEISTMLPKVTFFNGLFDLIRPLAYVQEAQLQRYAEQCGFPVASYRCPSRGDSKRQFVRDLLAQLHQADRRLKGHIFRALGNVNREYLWGFRRRQSSARFPSTAPEPPRFPLSTPGSDGPGP
jgi:tRNA 2-thiocytidine biosynthesis protein TtcA